MFLKYSDFYEKKELNKYNLVFIRKINEEKKYLKVIRKNPDIEKISFSEIKKDELNDFKTLKKTYLFAIKSLLIKEKIPINFAVELISNLKTGVNSESFEEIIESIKLVKENDEKKIIIIFIEKLIKKIDFL